MGKWFCLFAACFAVAVLAAVVASSARPTTRPTLHVGSHGKRVKNLQWLLKGHRPSHYRRFHPYKGRIDGHYGRRTGKAVRRMKFRMGYPKKLLTMRAGPGFVDILLGRHKRPVSYPAREKKRTAAIRAAARRAASCQGRIVRIANSQVGVREVPMGSNDGYFVRIYQSVTGAYHAPWCASFAQWVLYRAGKGPIANRSAAVFYIEWWARARGWLHSTPRRAALALFTHSAGHMGIVTSVGRSGFTTVDGNWGDQVSRVYHPYGSVNALFVYLPNCGT